MRLRDITQPFSPEADGAPLAARLRRLTLHRVDCADPNQEHHAYPGAARAERG